MSIVTIDSALLNSGVWRDRWGRVVFLTALLMAVPKSLKAPTAAIALDSNEPIGYVVPPGDYGFVNATATAICDAVVVGDDPDKDKHILDCRAALARLSAEDYESRTPLHGGRRMVRIPGGFIVLNYIKYHHTSSMTTAEKLAAHSVNNPSRDLGPSRGGKIGDAKCPSCHVSKTLMRGYERPEGANWYCNKRIGGCGFWVAIDHEKILEQLDAPSRALALSLAGVKDNRETPAEARRRKGLANLDAVFGSQA